MKRGVAKSPDDVLLGQREAQRIVGEPAIREAFEALKDGYRLAWERTTPAETEKRETAYCHFKAVADVWAALEKKAMSVQVRDKIAAQNEPKCPGCGVTDGELHKDGCAVLAARIRTMKLANG